MPSKTFVLWIKNAYAYTGWRWFEFDTLEQVAKFIQEGSTGGDEFVLTKLHPFTIYPYNL